MKWTIAEPLVGDMVRVKLGEIYHYGVYVGEDEIVEFGAPPTARARIADKDVCVCTTDVDGFVVGGVLEVAQLDFLEKLRRNSPEKTVKIARERLGEKGYNILHNNCEHFAYECVLGKRVCTQADDIRALFRAIPVVDVYVAPLPETESVQKLSTAARQKEVDACKNERVRREKYYAWKLLEYALQRSFGLKMQNVSFKKDKNGKWTTDECFFSLSHGGGYIAVACSRAPVGIDVETVDPARVQTVQKVLSPQENNALSSAGEGDLPRALTEIWTKKESLFKKQGKGAFIPRSVQTDGEKFFVKSIGETAVLAVATDTPERVRFYEGWPVIG